MTEEEKEGIKLIQGDIEDLLNDIENHKDYQNILEKEQIKLRKAVLNLIDKLQKGVDELDKENQRQAELLSNIHNKYRKENKELRDTNKTLYEMGKQRAIQEILSENWVNKDKIRELREIDNIDYLQFKLKELLGE